MQSRSMMIWTTRKLSHVTRNITARASVMGGTFCISKASSMGESEGQSIVTTMAFVTMPHPNATLLNFARNTFSPRTVLRSNRGSGRSGSSKTLKGKPRDAA
eukprot:6858232-Ditylum_brightwellii.AAC.1